MEEEFAERRHVAQRDQPGACVSAFVQRQDQRTIELGGVEGTGGVAEVMIEVARLPGLEELRKFPPHIHPGIGQSDKRDIGGLRASEFEAAGDGVARNGVCARRTAELVFFDGGEERRVIEQGSSGVAPEASDAEDQHGLMALRHTAPRQSRQQGRFVRQDKGRRSDR